MFSAEQPYLCGYFVQLHQILTQKIMKPSRILFFVLWQIAELIAVVQIESVKSADLLYLILACQKDILLRAVVIALVERL